jgi:hypothetical protein
MLLFRWESQARWNCGPQVTRRGCSKTRRNRPKAGTLEDGIALQEIAQARRHRQYPLPHRQAREDVIGQMRRRRHHARTKRRSSTSPTRDALAGHSRLMCPL